MHLIKECVCNRNFHNPGSSPRASCQVKFEPRRPPSLYHGSQALENLSQLTSCPWCGCFQWQCGHHHRHRGAVVLGAAARGTAVSGVEGSIRQQQVTAVYCDSGAGGTSSSAFGDPDGGCEAFGDRSHISGCGSGTGVLQSSSQHCGAVDGESAERGIRSEAGTHQPLGAPPCQQLQKAQLQQQREREHQQQQQVVEGTEAESCSRLDCSQTEQIKTPCQAVSGNGKRGRNGLSPPPRRTWNPGVNAPPHSLISDFGPGPPLPPLEPSLGQQSSSQLVPPPQKSSLIPTSPNPGEIFQLSVESAIPSEPISCTMDGMIKAGAVSGGIAGSVLVAAVPVVSATAGAAFRSALRRCRCLDEVESLLSGEAPPLPLPLPLQQPLSPSPQPQPMPSADTLSVPSLTAVFSALPRLPEAFTAAGRRQLRRLMTMRLTAPVVRAAQRGDVDAAGAAIMTAALAHLGPDVIDPRVGHNELLSALAEAGLAACRLAPEPGGARIGYNQGVPSPHKRRYGHSPRSYSTLLYGMAKLGFRPDGFWLDRYLSASTRQLHMFAPRDLAALTWALAVLQHRPRDAWLEELLSAWPTGHPGPGLQAGGCAGVGDADGPRDEMSKVLGVPAAAPPLHCHADAHSLSLMLWALWRLGVAAPPAWLDGAVVLCAVPAARTDAAPPFSWTRRNGAATPPLRNPSRVAVAPFAAATCQSLALVSYCLARMGHTPPQRVRAELLAAAEPLLQGGSAQDLVLLLAGVAHWPRRGAAAAAIEAAATFTAIAVVPEHWLQQVCQALRPRLAGCSAQALVLALSAMSHLGFSPGTAWLLEHEVALRPLIAAGHVDGRAAARITAAWARLRYCPGRNVVDRLLKILVAAATAGAGRGQYGNSSAAVRTTQYRSRLSARLFAEGLYGIAVLVAARWTAGEHQVPPPRPPIPGPLLATIHLRALLAASQSCLPYSYLDEALMHLRAWQLLRLAPPHQWLTNLTAVARTKLHSAPPKVLLELLQLLGWPGWGQLRELSPRRPAPPYSADRPLAYHHGQGQVLHQQHCKQQHDAVCPPAAAADDPSFILGGGGGGGLPVSAALVDAILQRLAPALPEMCLWQLASLGEAMVTLRVRPARAWLQRLLDAVRAGIQHGQQGSDLNLDLQFVHADQKDGVAPGPPDSVPAGKLAGVRALQAVVQLAAAVGDPVLQHVAAELLSGCGILAAAGSTAATHHAPGVTITTRNGSSRLQLQPLLQRPSSSGKWQQRGPRQKRVSEPPILDWVVVHDEGSLAASAVDQRTCLREK